MKKTFVIITLIMMSVLSGSSLFAQTSDAAKDDYLIIEKGWPYIDYITPEEIISVCTEDDFYKVYDRSLFRLDRNGYFYYDNDIIIPGAIPYVSLPTDSSLMKTSSYAQSKGIFYSDSYKPDFQASSELMENTRQGTVVYQASNLAHFAYIPTDKYQSLCWNYDAKPWVEGVSGYGIGESIKLFCTGGQFNSLIILNGYVDPARPDLYKKNSRIKKLWVIDLDNYREYIFFLEDAVEFQVLNFRSPIKQVLMTIEEVYPGESWDDTCVTAIIPAETYVDNRGYMPLQQSYTYKEDKQTIQDTIAGIKSDFRLWEPDSDFSGK